jgi:hypothetical protein
MQTLITIGVVIYILLSIRKALKYGQTGGKPGGASQTGKPAPGSWQDKLQEMARQIKEEMEKANRQASGLPPVPPPLPTGGRVPSRDPWEDMDEEAPPPLTLEETVDEDARDLELSETWAEPSAPAEMPADDVLPEAPKPWDMKRPKKIKGKINRKKLSQAVVWSEILAKPLSLRE